MKTKKLVWRLGKLPTVEELLSLKEHKLITDEEIKSILFNQEEVESRDNDSLKSEIKFLRELVEKLSKGSTPIIVESIRYIEKPYYKHPWYTYYGTWGIAGDITTGSNITNAVNNLATYTGSVGNNGSLTVTQPCSFSSIQTF